MRRGKIRKKLYGLEGRKLVWKQGEECVVGDAALTFKRAWHGMFAYFSKAFQSQKVQTKGETEGEGGKGVLELV